MQETQEMWVRPLDQEDPPEENMATCSSILAWKIPWTEEPVGLQSKGSQRVVHNWATKHTHTSQERDCFHQPRRFLVPPLPGASCCSKCCGSLFDCSDKATRMPSVPDNWVWGHSLLLQSIALWLFPAAKKKKKKRLILVDFSGFKAGGQFDSLCKVTFLLILYYLVFLILQWMYICQLYDHFDFQICLKIKVWLESWHHKMKCGTYMQWMLSSPIIEVKSRCMRQHGWTLLLLLLRRFSRVQLCAIP